eukprot:362057-Chlamydomonas_euryale.AAC.19
MHPCPQYPLLRASLSSVSSPQSIPVLSILSSEHPCPQYPLLRASLSSVSSPQSMRPAPSPLPPAAARQWPDCGLTATLPGCRWTAARQRPDGSPTLPGGVWSTRSRFYTFGKALERHGLPLLAPIQPASTTSGVPYLCYRPPAPPVLQTAYLTSATDRLPHLCYRPPTPPLLQTAYLTSATDRLPHLCYRPTAPLCYRPTAPPLLQTDCRTSATDRLPHLTASRLPGVHPAFAQFDVVIVSPLMRALETAAGAFAADPSVDTLASAAAVAADPSVDPSADPFAGAHARASDASTGVPRPPLMAARNEVAGRRVARGTVASDGAPPFVVHELCREIMGIHPCDRRRDTEAAMRLFPGADWSLVADATDMQWQADVREPRAAVARRAREFLLYVMQ